MLSPLDDRYFDKVAEVREIFSVQLHKEKLEVECDYSKFFYTLMKTVIYLR